MLNKLKHHLRDLFRYPSIEKRDVSYDTYWHHRDTISHLNSFQKKRADLLLGYLKSGDTLLDVGCGDGKTLAYLKNKISLSGTRGIDSSLLALEKAKERGIETIQGNIQHLGNVPRADVVILFEVLEHVASSEELLRQAIHVADRLVVFSVPNTGFIMHRLRLFFGKFPLQWRVHPSEHLRFWTMHDMSWWLNQLGYTKTGVRGYEGIPILNKLWPSLFAAGLFVTLPK